MFFLLILELSENDYVVIHLKYNITACSSGVKVLVKCQEKKYALVMKLGSCADQNLWFSIKLCGAVSSTCSVSKTRVSFGVRSGTYKYL